ncbi:glycosyltransferase, MGT family protein [Kalymmatonema gypsitolerans NIES-4073]|uniref:glycosyltransferase n=1 Tax=Scytonema sp. PRP1 TaxID=3120513 RepID=UPI000B602A4E|nr:glycosyltransferase, MGT family protein [Scytonema sp. NIES-4073]
MSHFGIICPATAGHLNPMTALGWELQQRGHRVTLFGILDAQASTRLAGLEFRAIGESLFPLGAMTQIFSQQGKLSGLGAIRYTVTWLQNITATFLKEAPAAIKEAGVEALLIDQVSPEGETIANFLDIPFVSIGCALMSYRDFTIPPSSTLWSYSPAWWARLRNQLGYALLDRVVQPVVKVIADYRCEWNLPTYTSPNDLYSQLALISQQVTAFEFPRQNLPEHVHFTGPLFNSKTRQSVDFPFEQLTGQPLVYASLGTLQNRLQYVFEYIAQACAGLDVQLIISLGGGISPESMPELPGSPIVVQYAPQLELLEKASLVITHAGLNTTLESLSYGVPMVAIPISLDQPGVAARIAWTGTGKAVPLSRLSVPKLRESITQVLTGKSYKTNAVQLQQAIQNAPGVRSAASVIEKVVSTRKPVKKSS